MTTTSGRIGSGGTKKIGRNKIKCQKYKNEHRREKNKIRKWKKIIKKLLPNNPARTELELKIKKLEMGM